MQAQERCVTMSRRELDRLEVVQRIFARRMSQRAAGEVLGLTERQVRRLCRAYEASGPDGLVSKKRGRTSNRCLPPETRAKALELIRGHYHDFGPTLAQEKLGERHELVVSVETLRKWMTEDGIWTPRQRRRGRVHQPRARRPCRGELIQIDGCDHEWFEERGPRCTLLVYVDDATSEIMEARFVESESTFSYWAATRSYIERHGKPVAFYSDKASVFRVAPRSGEEESPGISQFRRALTELNIDSICANSAQAKGRVERAHLTLQDRLVKELRLAGVSTMEDANAFMAAYIEDYNGRFACVPRSAHDAHRPLTEDEDLDRVFTWQVTRKVSKNLTLRYEKALYILDPTEKATATVGHRVLVHEAADGRVEIRHGGVVLPYHVFDTQPHVNPPELVSGKRLGAVMKLAKELQEERDAKRLASPKITLREKAWIRAGKTRSEAAAPR